MPNSSPFSEALDAAQRLSLDEQQALAEILHRQVCEQRRASLVKEVQDAVGEFQAGQCQPRSPSELAKELES
jgi:hypothetical protein